MTQVKIFTVDINNEPLENSINTWLNEHYYLDVIDIKFISPPEMARQEIMVLYNK